MRSIIKAYFVCVFILIVKFAGASHLVGGEIYYDNLGGNNYKIHLKIYRDCSAGGPPLDDPAVIDVFDVNNKLVKSLDVLLYANSEVPTSYNSPCAPTEAGDVCLEVGFYEITVNLPPKVGGYTITYQRCCRHGTIINLINPLGLGATYWEHIPGPEVVAVNNSPRFTFNTPIYICSNSPIAFNHMASDPDGDLLVYSICAPFDGIPLVNPANPAGSINPPPYSSVNFVLPYSSGYPMSSSPAININKATGFINGSPNILGQWVIGIRVSEYRAGILIGTHHRDFQFNVINCPNMIIADIGAQTTTNNGTGAGYCNGMSVSFQNNSSANATAYHWDFGVQNILTDTSNLQNPSYLYSTPGDYTITLIANPGSKCADTTFQVFHVHPLLNPSFLQPSDQCLNSNKFSFAASGNFQGNGTFNWNFGNSATPLTASTKTINNVSYTLPGVKTVSLTVAENDCFATTTQTFEIAENPVAYIGNYITSACAPVTFTIQNLSNSVPHISYLWTFSNGTSSQNMTPTVTFANPGIYTFTLTAISSSKCIDTSTLAGVSSISVAPYPVSQFIVTTNSVQCFNGHTFSFLNTSTFSSIFSGAPTYNWDFGANATPAIASTFNISNVLYNTSGIYPVTLTVTQNSCASTSSINVELYPNPVAILGPYPKNGCLSQIVNFTRNSTSASPLTYLWSFSDGATSTDANPSHVFSSIGVYSFSLTVSTTSLCISSSSIQSVNSITINLSPIAGFSITTDNVSEVICKDTSSSDVVSWNYNFNDGTNSQLQNPIHYYHLVDIYNIVQTVTNSFGCKSNFDLDVMIIPDFGFYIPNAFTPGGLKDHLNDIFKPVIHGIVEYEFSIYDRWGVQIYSSNNIDEGWDGSYKGLNCQVGVYIWKCDFKNKTTKKYEQHVGHVALLK